ncbi:MAG: mechanosensitive ion channel protein MscS [Lysobacteraceae bacterium]|nr:MAG: mechanosensitive ion channel protein MscS [Xanthomonadaceae bacterium]
MNELVDVFSQWVGDHARVAVVFLVVFVALLLDFIQRRVVARLKREADRSENLWDDAIIYAIKKPLGLLIWVLGLSLAVHVVADGDSAWVEGAWVMRTIGVILALTWFSVRLIRGLENNFIESRQRADEAFDRTTVDAVGKLLRVSVLITAVLVTLQSLGFSVSGVLAFGGIGGIAVGLAAKDLLANFFGGLTVYLDRPFAVGDWIRSPDRDIEGVVEEIGWRQTRIRKFDKRPIYVPNATFTSIAVENPSRMTHRRIYESIGVRYDDMAAVEAIVSDVKAMLQEHEGIDQSQTLMVNFDAFSASSLDFFIYALTNTTVWQEYHEIKQDVLLKAAKIIDKHDAEIAFPTQTLHVATVPELAGLESAS